MPFESLLNPAVSTAEAEATYTPFRAELRFDPTSVADGAIPATADTGQPFTTFESTTAPAPLVISGGRIAHTPYAGVDSAGYLEVELSGRVKRIGCRVAWPTNAIGNLALVIPSAEWSAGVLPNAGFHLVVFGNGQWTLKRFSTSGSTTLASNSTHGRWNSVWGGTLVTIDVFLDPDAQSVLIVWPDGSAAKVSSAYFASETANFAVWELYESDGTTVVAATIGEIWASSAPLGPSASAPTPISIFHLGNPAQSNVSGSLTINWDQSTVQELTLTGNVTALAFSGTPRRGEMLHLELIQDGTGSRTLSGAGSTIKWAGATAPTLSTTAARRDIFTFRYAGQNYYEVSRSMNVNN